jgi:hypothetical protein
MVWVFQKAVIPKMLLMLLTLLGPAVALAAAPAPQIAILIDDMGYRHADCWAALRLPDPVAFSFLPHAPHTRRLVGEAQAQGRDILLHIPMENQHKAMTGLGPGALMADMPQPELSAILREDLALLPEAIGVNNHMGSLLTAQRQPMGWVMTLLKAHGGLFFLDSRTTGQSVAGRIATEHGLPTLQRDIFLDNEKTESHVAQQFQALVAAAKRKGTAIAIGHPHPATLAVLRRELARLPAYGVRLIRLNALLLAK